ncbi:hypothetical protein ccbrp13_37490 [Ktedonobacteria bacterium brp13]|nr:hypothetical protein ccbrp13_37490 [Ktedonobacteria bacterium brp13]
MRRGEGAITESGAMAFVQGRIVSAQIGSYTGPAAFNLLRTWGQCIFMFTPRSLPTALQQNSPAPSRSSQELPVITPQQSIPAPSQISQELPQSSPVRPQISQELSQRSPVRPQISQALPLGPSTDPLSLSRSLSTGPQLPVSPSGPLSLTTIPRATMSVFKAIAVIEKAGLPRTYRQVILMVDGRNSVNELIGPSGCSLEEIQQILYTLEKLMIIRIS